MKYVVALQNKLNAVKAQAFNCLTKKDGQNTVEYVLMLVVIVGIALVAGKALQAYFPELMGKVKEKISGGIDNM